MPTASDLIYLYKNLLFCLPKNKSFYDLLFVFLDDEVFQNRGYSYKSEFCLVIFAPYEKCSKMKSAELLSLKVYLKVYLSNNLWRSIRTDQHHDI